LIKNGMMLKFIPYEKRTVELCEIAVNNNGDAIQYVPEEKRTDKLYELAFKTISESALQFITYDLRLRPIGRENYHERVVKRNATDLALQSASTLPHSKNIFDIIVVVRSHGGCPEPCKVLECIVKIPETVKLSVMRGSNYGVCGFFLCDYSFDPTWIRKLVPEIMEKNNSKEAVFEGMQKAFQYIKKDHIDFFKLKQQIKHTDLKRRLVIEDIGFSFKIDHTKYINSIYGDSSHDPILKHVVYVDPSVKTQLNQLYLTSLKDLQSLVNYLHDCEFKNIGVVEDMCHSFSEVCNPGEICQAQEMNEVNGIFGGKRKKRTRKRKGTQRKKLRTLNKIQNKIR